MKSLRARFLLPAFSFGEVKENADGQLQISRVYLKTPNAPGQRTFSRCAAPFFLEIRQYSCEKMSCSAQKFLAAGHIGSFQIHPRQALVLQSLRTHILTLRALWYAPPVTGQQICKQLPLNGCYKSDLHSKFAGKYGFAANFRKNKLIPAFKRPGAGQLPAPGWVLSVCIYRQARP